MNNQQELELPMARPPLPQAGEGWGEGGCVRRNYLLRTRPLASRLVHQSDKSTHLCENAKH